MSEYNTMLKEVQKLDFALLEAALFLDINNRDAKALKYYCHYQRLAVLARKRFEERFGPLTHQLDNDNNKWQWTEEPWPWEYKEADYVGV